MVDFLKANPYMSMEDYMWKYSIPMIKIMGMDNSHVNYLSEKQAKGRGGKTIDTKTRTIEEISNDLGIKIAFPSDV